VVCGGMGGVMWCMSGVRWSVGGGWVVLYGVMWWLSGVWVVVSGVWVKPHHHDQIRASGVLGVFIAA
jgi:hypothetical protein